MRLGTCQRPDIVRRRHIGLQRICVKNSQTIRHVGTGRTESGITITKATALPTLVMQGRRKEVTCVLVSGRVFEQMHALSSLVSRRITVTPCHQCKRNRHLQAWSDKDIQHSNRSTDTDARLSLGENVRLFAGISHEKWFSGFLARRYALFIFRPGYNQSERVCTKLMPLGCPDAIGRLDFRFPTVCHASVSVNIPSLAFSLDYADYTLV